MWQSMAAPPLHCPFAWNPGLSPFWPLTLAGSRLHVHLSSKNQSLRSVTERLLVPSCSVSFLSSLVITDGRFTLLEAIRCGSQGFLERGRTSLDHFQWCSTRGANDLMSAVRLLERALGKPVPLVLSRPQQIWISGTHTDAVDFTNWIVRLNLQPNLSRALSWSFANAFLICKQNMSF